MKRIDLSDTAVLLSLKTDSAARLENLQRILSYYAAMTEGGDVVIVNQGRSDLPDPPPSIDVQVHHLPDEGFHWKTRNLNHAAALSMRPFLMFTDVDMVPKPAALGMALDSVRNGESFVHLFDGLVANIGSERLKTFKDWPGLIASLPHFARDEVKPGASVERDHVTPLYGDANHRATGGGFVCRRDAFFEVGGYNENFVSYGGEDQEFSLRVEKLSGGIRYIEGHNLYHLDHPRGVESRYGVFYRQNMVELERVAGMEPDRLRSYAARRFSAMTFDPGHFYTRKNTPTAVGWEKRPDTRRSLADLTILVIADPARVSPAASCLDPFLDHLEEAYTDLDVRICEPGSSAFKFPKNRNHIVHHPFAGKIPADRLRALVGETGRTRSLVIRLDNHPDRQLPRIKARVLSAATGRTQTAPTTGRQQRRDPEFREKNAIYLRFNDAFRDHALACLKSLETNYPGHPTILADYSGEDRQLGEVLDRLGARRLPPADPPDFTRYLRRERARDHVIARFRLWRSDFRHYDTILHLDADTLVLAPLDAPFGRDEPFIVANHEPSLEVRIFAEEHRTSADLRKLLEDDGLTYPAHADDMGNAGVFTLPKSVRRRADIRDLSRLAERYGAYFAYADQSLISLWLRQKGIRPTRDFAMNFQTPFFTAKDISVPFEDIHVLHFSSPRKPGTDSFQRWHRAGDALEHITALFEHYRTL